MITIGDIVSVDAEAEFSSIVRLDAYDSRQHNIALLRSYLFSGSAPATGASAVRAVSSVALLGHMVDSFLQGMVPGRAEPHNCFVAIANYGHGKSHFGLAMANFFGRAPNSPELKVLLPKIENALGNPSSAQRYRDFKQMRGAFLVVRMSGDKPGSLREQFLRSLEVAIDEHESTAGRRPEFWYSTAERVLGQLSPELQEQANKFLGEWGTELSQLVQDIRRRTNVYDLCVSLLTHLHGVPPNLGGEAGLEEVVTWAATNLCGEGKPLGGMVILVDEFSAFVQLYAQRNAAMELQMLLNGVAKQQGKVVFLALGQHDPVTLAQSLALPTVQLSSLLRELNRITKKYALYSLMESVIDSYLQQSEQEWLSITSDRRAKGAIYQATNVAYEQFKQRYDHVLRWPLEKFQETVTKGCYPLHPVTTALLCNLKFGSADGMDTPRTVLGFVLEELEGRKDDQALVNGKLQWVLPVRLVDYFETRLQGDLFQAYLNAMRFVDEQAPPEHELVLKALLLQDASGVKAHGDDQLNFLAQSSGVEFETTKQILQTLCNSGCIRYDVYHRVNSFWPASNKSDVAEEIIKAKIASPSGERSFTDGESPFAELEDALKLVAGDAFGTIPLQVPWGEAGDWAASERVLTMAQISEETLPSLATTFSATVRGLESGERGVVAWLVARTDEEVAWYRNNLSQIVERSFPGETPIPAMFVVPSAPTPALFEQFQRKHALESFTQDEIEQSGHEVYNSKLSRAKLDLLHAFGAVRGDNVTYMDLPRSPNQYVVPVAYRGRINRLPSSGIRAALRECYSDAYRNAPPEFRTDWKVARGALRDATRLVGGLLLQNSPKSLRDGVAASSPAKGICDKFLHRAWQLLSSDYRIREPDAQSVRRAWDFLESKFPAGVEETQLRPVLMALLNPPHGYDYNTATLLFCAWFGFHGQDLQLSARGRLIDRETLTSWLVRGPKEFIAEMCIAQNVSLARRDPGELRQEVAAILERMKNSTFSQDDAVKAISRLREFAKDDRNSAEVQRSVTERAAALEDGLGQARKYDQDAGKVQQEIASERQLANLIALQGRIGALPRPTLVETVGPSATELRAQALERLGQIIESDCQRFENLGNRTELLHHEQELKGRKTIVQRAGLAELVQRCDVALRKLEEKAKALEVQESEKQVGEAIRGMDITAGLKSLYEYQTRLEGMIGLSEPTMELRRKCLTEVEKEIRRLEEQADSWLDTIGRMSDAVEVDRLRDDLLRVSGRYSGTAYEVVVSERIAQIEKLRSFFADLKTIDSQIRPGRIAVPADAEQFSSAIEALTSTYAASLSDGTRARIVEAKGRLRTTVEEQRQKAIAWMRERRAEYETGHNLPGLQEKLRIVPAFLPEDTRIELHALIKQVNERVGQDTIARIAQAFRGLAHRKQQEECLSVLQRVLEES